jgi:hypothetical protein
VVAVAQGREEPNAANADIRAPSGPRSAIGYL